MKTHPSSNIGYLGLLPWYIEPDGTAYQPQSQCLHPVELREHPGPRLHEVPLREHLHLCGEGGGPLALFGDIHLRGTAEGGTGRFGPRGAAGIIVVTGFWIGEKRGWLGWEVFGGFFISFVLFQLNSFQFFIHSHLFLG